MKLRIGSFLAIIIFLLICAGIELNIPARALAADHASTITAPKSKICIVFLSGLGSYCDGSPYGQMGFHYLRRQLKKAGFSYKDEHFLKYSYCGGELRQGKWQPYPYSPDDTGQPIQLSVMHLKDMVDEIGLHCPEARFLFVGHSLGGRIAFDYLVEKETNKQRIKTVLTLNAPLTGTPYSNLNFLGELKTSWNCPAVRQLAAEHRLYGESDLFIKKIKVLKQLTAAGLRLATFATKEDLIVNPSSAYLGNYNLPSIRCSILSVPRWTGKFFDLFGHRQILTHPQVTNYLLSCLAGKN